jgi:nucleotide-binding universal stress UspA family protein
MTSSKYVVVGVDGSHDGLRAVEYGAREAVARRQRLLLVHAYHVAPVVNPTLPWYGVDARRRFGVRAMEAARGRAEQAAPRTVIDEALVRTTPARALVNASACASIVVLGRHHRHGAQRIFSGSTSAAVAARAKAPVVTVPDQWTTASVRRSIVAGTDGSDGARDAVLFAFEAAQDRRAPLVVVRVCETPLSWHEQIEALDDTSVDWAEQAERDLAEELAGWTADYPDVAVTRRIARARWAAETLVTVAADAGLLVVGARGLGGLRGLDLGETARSVVAHASCPVAVVHRGDLRADDVRGPVVSGVGTPA